MIHDKWASFALVAHGLHRVNVPCDNHIHLYFTEAHIKLYDFSLVSSGFLQTELTLPKTAHQLQRTAF